MRTRQATVVSNIGLKFETTIATQSNSFEARKRKAVAILDALNLLEEVQVLRSSHG